MIRALGQHLFPVIRLPTATAQEFPGTWSLCCLDLLSSSLWGLQVSQCRLPLFLTPPRLGFWPPARKAEPDGQAGWGFLGPGWHFKVVSRSFSTHSSFLLGLLALRRQCGWQLRATAFLDVDICSGRTGRMPLGGDPRKSAEEVRLHWGGLEGNAVLHVQAVAVTFITAKEHVFLLAGDAGILHTSFWAAQDGILIEVFCRVTGRPR